MTKPLVFRGAIANRTFDRMTENEFRKALAGCGWRQAHNGHVFQRLRMRGPSVGIRTPGDLERAMRGGERRPSRGVIAHRLPRGGVVVYRPSGELITFTFDSGPDRRPRSAR